MAQKKRTLDTLEAILAEAGERTHADVASSFNHYEALTNKDVLNGLEINTLQPAFDEFYKSFEKQLNEAGLKDDKHIAKSKLKDVKKAAVEAFKSYFKKTNKGVLRALEHIDKDDIEAQYEVLVTHYDNHVGAGGQSQIPGIDQLIRQYVGNKEETLGGFKTRLYDLKAAHKRGVVETLKSNLYGHFAMRYQPIETAQYLAKKAKESKFEITDPAKFLSLGHQELQAVYQGLRSGDFGQGGPKNYFLKPVKKKAPLPSKVPKI